MLIRRTRRVAILITALALVAACGSDDDASEPTATDVGTPAGTGAPAETAAPPTEAPAETAAPATDAPAATEAPVSEDPIKIAALTSLTGNFAP